MKSLVFCCVFVNCFVLGLCASMVNQAVDVNTVIETVPPLPQNCNKQVDDLKKLIKSQGDDLKKQASKHVKDIQKYTEMLKKSASGPSCKNLKDMGFNKNGVYTITGGSTPFEAYCDMSHGGFTVFQRRFDGSTDFNQTFQAYASGFGKLCGEFWLGLEKLHQFTKTGKHQLRVELVAYDGAIGYALYEDFSIGAAPGYKLHVGAYSGTAGDELTYHNNQNFSTLAHDVDLWSRNCASVYQGAFWYNACLHVNINAFDYHGKGNKGMRWNIFNSGNAMKATSMTSMMVL